MRKDSWEILEKKMHWKIFHWLLRMILPMTLHFSIFPLHYSRSIQQRHFPNKKQLLNGRQHSHLHHLRIISTLLLLVLVCTTHHCFIAKPQAVSSQIGCSWLIWIRAWKGPAVTFCFLPVWETYSSIQLIEKKVYYFDFYYSLH